MSHLAGRVARAVVEDPVADVARAAFRHPQLPSLRRRCERARRGARPGSPAPRRRSRCRAYSRTPAPDGAAPAPAAPRGSTASPRCPQQRGQSERGLLRRSYSLAPPAAFASAGRGHAGGHGFRRRRRHDDLRELWRGRCSRRGALPVLQRSAQDRLPGVRYAGAGRRGRLSRLRRLARTRDRRVLARNASGRLRPSEGDRTDTDRLRATPAPSLERGKRAVLLGLRTARFRERTRRRLPAILRDAASSRGDAWLECKAGRPAVKRDRTQVLLRSGHGRCLAERSQLRGHVSALP
jgi:hypothetical protein